MGLDWMLSDRKPKPGCEKHTDLEAELEQVAITPYEVIGAPRVGIDDAATAWFKSQVFEDDLKTLGLRHRRSHDLRRTFISLALCWSDD